MRMKHENQSNNMEKMKTHQNSIEKSSNKMNAQKATKQKN